MEALAAALDGSGPAILPLDATLPRARLGELLEAFAPASIETSQEFQRGSGAGRLTQASVHAAGVDDDVAVVLATSGSTGLPKGAELTAAALTASATASLARLGAIPGERWLCCLPVHHISGLGVLVRSLLAGSTPVITDRADVGVLVREAAQPGSGCHYVSLVPTQLRRLLDAGAPPRGFRGILLGGAAVPPGLLDEAAASRSQRDHDLWHDRNLRCVYDGVPLDGVQVTAGADSRIKISGPVCCSPRYRLAPELTRAALQGGWFVTSDLASWTTGGSSCGDGRRRINSGGEKVVAGEVEHVLRGCPGVRDAVVVGTPDPDWGERVPAMIVAADEGDPPLLEEIRAYVRDRLPRYAAPQAMVLVADLPMLPSGKPDRQLLRDIAVQEGR
jgi:O-succinylbenzoic acid--CoA ligase